MSARQDVFTYLKANSNAPLKEVLSEFSKTKDTTVRRYYFEYQKTEKKPVKPQKQKKISAKKTVEPKSKKIKEKKSLKQLVIEFLEQSPDSLPKELSAAFPKAHKTTLGNYRRQWQKQKETTTEKPHKDLKKAIFKYLDKNPSSNINDLKKVFPEAANKLITVFRSWKNDQHAKSAKADGVSVPPITPGEISETDGIEKPSWLEKQKETIAKQKKIIEKQKSKIQGLKNQMPRIKKTGLIDSLKNFILEKVRK
ncbi:hypothetical protein KJ966_03000 [bacterium]|nr:hypothetical protein [bacterium]